MEFRSSIWWSHRIGNDIAQHALNMICRMLRKRIWWKKIGSLSHHLSGWWLSHLSSSNQRISPLCLTHTNIMITFQRRSTNSCFLATWRLTTARRLLFCYFLNGFPFPRTIHSRETSLKNLDNLMMVESLGSVSPRKKLPVWPWYKPALASRVITLIS